MSYFVINFRGTEIGSNVLKLPSYFHQPISLFWTKSRFCYLLRVQGNTLCLVDFLQIVLKWQHNNVTPENNNKVLNKKENIVTMFLRWWWWWWLMFYGLQICPRRDSNTGGSDMWSSTLPLDHGGALQCSWVYVCYHTGC